jgi:hypothetical protein
MLGYRKKSFYRAHELLNALRSNLDDLDTLRNLQQLLVREIIRTEAKSREVRSNLKAVQSNGGKASQKQAASLKSRLEKIRQVAYVWRCFGDAIAFSYMDKFALKQCFYSSHSTNPKQGAGFLSGKSGLAGEIGCVEMALQQNIPAILTDITNTIRYGDVCLMGASDPYLIEVKNSKKLDHRGKRQQRDILGLQQFFETDKTEMLRGMGPAFCVSHSGDERDHVDQLQTTIATAVENGHCVTQPEPGLYYIVLADAAPPVSEVMKSLSVASPWLFFLNTMKNDQAWSPYLPFTLTIKDRDHLWAFIRGEIFIVVVLDFQQLIDIAKKFGLSMQLDLKDENYPLEIDIPGGEKPAKISSHILTRIGLEFVSPNWLISSSIESLKNVISDFARDQGGGEGLATISPDPDKL